MRCGQGAGAGFRAVLQMLAVWESPSERTHGRGRNETGPSMCICVPSLASSSPPSLSAVPAPSRPHREGQVDEEAAERHVPRRSPVAQEGRGGAPHHTHSMAHTRESRWSCLSLVIVAKLGVCLQQNGPKARTPSCPGHALISIGRVPEGEKHGWRPMTTVMAAAHTHTHTPRASCSPSRAMCVSVGADDRPGPGPGSRARAWLVEAARRPPPPSPFFFSRLQAQPANHPSRLPSPPTPHSPGGVPARPVHLALQPGRRVLQAAAGQRSTLLNVSGPVPCTGRASGCRGGGGVSGPATRPLPSPHTPRTHAQACAVGRLCRAPDPRAPQLPGRLPRPTWKPEERAVSHGSVSFESTTSRGLRKYTCNSPIGGWSLAEGSKSAPPLPPPGSTRSSLQPRRGARP